MRFRFKAALSEHSAALLDDVALLVNLALEDMITEPPKRKMAKPIGST